MKDPLVSHVKEFLAKHLSKEGGAILLGFSGGGDSLALLYLLLECGQTSNLHLAHVDHGWREESAEEAEELSLLAKKLGLPFHLRRLEKKAGKNQEARARDERSKFFSEVYAKNQCQALLLAHHADDQAETVLKRVLEGAHFLSLGGMKEALLLEGMKLLRPLLDFRKKTLEQWLTNRGCHWIEDATNRDPAFLRARMRTEILPSLAESFGKEISSNLVRLGRTMEQVEEMIRDQVEACLKTTRRDPLGLFLEVPAIYPRLVRSAIVRRFAAGEDFFISYDALEAICELLESKAPHRLFLSGEKKLVVDRGTLCLKRCFS